MWYVRGIAGGSYAALRYGLHGRRDRGYALRQEYVEGVYRGGESAGGGILLGGILWHLLWLFPMIQDQSRLY